MSTVPDSERITDAVSGDAAETAVAAGDASASPGPVRAAAALVFDDPLDRPSPDETDRGWGESAAGAGDDDFTRFLSEKPPHHL